MMLCTQYHVEIAVECGVHYYTSLIAADKDQANSMLREVFHGAYTCQLHPRGEIHMYALRRGDLWAREVMRLKKEYRKVLARKFA